MIGAVILQVVLIALNAVFGKRGDRRDLHERNKTEKNGGGRQ